jgi:hypothetical protein
MEVWTDLVGIQVYCGGWLAKDGNAGKGNSKVTYRRGVALETQFYPDSVNHSNIKAKAAAAVQSPCTLIFRSVIFHTVNRKLGVTNSVSISTDRKALVP